MRVCVCVCVGVLRRGSVGIRGLAGLEPKTKEAGSFRLSKKRHGRGRRGGMCQGPGCCSCL